MPGPKHLAAARRLLLASSRLASHLSRPGETTNTGCSAHPNQSEGFASASCWCSRQLRPRCQQMCHPSTHPRGGAMRPFQRSMFIRAPSRAGPAHAEYPDLPICSLPRASQAGITRQSRLALRCPRFHPQDEQRIPRQIPRKTAALQGIVRDSATRGIVGALIAITNRARRA